MPLDLNALREPAARVRLAVFDVDGVFTDGRLIYGPQGEAYKTFHVRDGYGLVQLGAAGIVIAIISGRESKAVSTRMRELRIEYVYQGITDKHARLKAFLAEQHIAAEQTCYVGDDLADLAPMRIVGLPVAVADACAEIQEVAAATTHSPGGHGAVREVCDLLLAARRP